MLDIFVEVKYCINHNDNPKTVICKITVGLPMGNPNKDYSLNTLLYDNTTEFMGEVLNEKWGRYDSSRNHFRRFATKQYDCEYVFNPDGITIVPVSLGELVRELAVLEQVIKHNIALKNALPAKKEFTVPFSEIGKLDLSALC